jgi:DNA-binding transcriptional MerR regulator
MEKKFSQITMEFAGVESDSEQMDDAGQVENPSADQHPGSDPIAIAAERPVKAFSKRGRPSLKQMDVMADLVNVPPDDILFQKQYYSIGQVAQWFGLNQSLVRYWETEFDILQPRKNRKGDRFFRPIDVKNLQLIHDLLRRRKFTLEGAKDYLKNTRKAEEKFAMIQSLEKIRGFFLELKATL